VTPEVDAALAAATDVVGYIPYVARVAPCGGLMLHPADNRVELDRAAHALELAAQFLEAVGVRRGWLLQFHAQALVERNALIPAAALVLEARKAAATKVEFFTMVRNRGPK
jgi:hypothetical protein